MSKPKWAPASKAYASVLLPSKRAAEIPGEDVAIRRSEGNISWQREQDLRSEGSSAHDFEPGSHPLRSFRHSQQAATTAVLLVKHAGVHASTIVTDQHPKIMGGKVELSLDVASLGVAEGVQQSLTGNAIDVLEDSTPKRPSVPFYDDAKLSSRRVYFPGYSRQRQLEPMTVAATSTQIRNAVSAFLNGAASTGHMNAPQTEVIIV
jgi:hypothetical protein